MAKEKKSVARKVAHAAGWQVVKRGAKMLPFGGIGIALFLVGSDIRRKGLVRGVINSGLDAIPGVGLVKNGIEIVRGDFIPDKEEIGNGTKKA